MEALKKPPHLLIGQQAQRFPFQPETGPESRQSRALIVGLTPDSGYPSTAWPALSEEEENEAIRLSLPNLLVAAQKEKHYRQQREEQARKIAEQSFVPGTPELMFSEIQKRGFRLAAQRHWRKPFSLTEWNSAIYRVLSMYFSGSERFETEGPTLLGLETGSFSLHKGIILAGPKGVGKSDMMELFTRNPYQSFSIVSCVELENEYGKKEGGPNVIDQYSGMIPNEYTGHYYGQTQLGICFDDFGAEGEAVHMGKRINMMDMLLQTRYRTCRGPYTHLTTNASQEQIQATYDGRVYDRMIQMFNLIEFDPNTPSLRV